MFSYNVDTDSYEILTDDLSLTGSSALFAETLTIYTSPVQPWCSDSFDVTVNFHNPCEANPTEIIDQVISDVTVNLDDSSPVLVSIGEF